MNNTYYLLRHGESLKNVKEFQSSWPEKSVVPLTKKGINQIKAVAKKLKDKNIEYIFNSDLLRTKQTADIVGKIIGIKPKDDKRLREIGLGEFNGKSIKEYGNYWNKGEKTSPVEHYLRRFKLSPPGGENYTDIENKLIDFLKEIEKKYKNKNILIISHGRTLSLFEKVIYKHSEREFVNFIINKKEIKPGELKKLIWK